MKFENEKYCRDLLDGMRLRGRQKVDGAEGPMENYGRELYDDKYDTLQVVLKQLLSK